MITIYDLTTKKPIVVGRQWEHCLDLLEVAKKKHIVNGDFKCSDFSNKEIVEFVFENCVFDGSVFNNILFKDCLFLNCSMKSIKFAKNKCMTCKFVNCTLEGSDQNKSIYEKCEIENTNFSRNELKAASFLDTKFLKPNSTFYCCDMYKIDLRGTDMSGMTIVHSFIRDFLYSDKTIINWLSHLVVSEYLLRFANGDIKKQNLTIVWFYNQNMCDEAVNAEHFETDEYHWMTQLVGKRYKENEPIHPYVLKFMRDNKYTKY